MDLHEIKRNYFRIDVRGNDAVSISINTIPYDIIDIGDRGIGIRLTSEDIFISVGDELPLELKIENQVFKLQGKVVHISPSEPEELLCGIQFMTVDEKIKAKMMKQLQSLREKIFREA